MRLALPHIVLSALLLSSAQLGAANPVFGWGNGNGNGKSQIQRPNLQQQYVPNQSHSSMSARDAVAIAERRYGGRAVGVRQIQGARGTAYNVRILLDNGKIKNVVIE